MGLKDRLLQFIDNKRLTVQEFELRTGLSNGAVSKMGDNTRVATLEKISIVFPDLDIDWLRTGKESTAKELNKAISYTSGRPYYNVDFVGGFDLMLNDQTVNPEYYIDFPPYNKDGIIWCNITGRSMEPQIGHGDIIALREVLNWKSYLNYGEVYAIITYNDLRTVKIVRKGSDDAHLRLIPINTEEFDEQEIEKSMIMRVYAVVGCIKRM